jgi:CBS domain-containing protein
MNCGPMISANSEKGPSMPDTYTPRPHSHRTLESIRVAETMHRGVFTCKHEATLFTVARLLAAHRIHAVAVAPPTDEGSWGVVSDFDLAIVFSDGLLNEATAGSVASVPKVFVGPDDTLTRAAQLMSEYGTHHLIVLVRGTHRPVGIISTLDIAEALAEFSEFATLNTGGEVR